MRRTTTGPRRFGDFAVVGLVAIALALGACSDDDGSDTSTDTTEAPSGDVDSTTDPSAGSETSGSPVRVMVVDNGESSSQPQPEVMASARGAEAGLADSPRPVEIVPCEVVQTDPADTGPAMACVRQAIDEGVAAFIGSLPEDGSVLLADAGIPQFSAALSNFELTNENSFLTTGGAQLLFAAQGVSTAEHGGSRVAILGFDIEAAAPLIDLAKQGVEAAGGEIAAEIFVPFQAVDVSPQIQQVADADADAVLVITTEDIAANIIRTIDQFGLDVAISIPAGGARQETLDALGPLSEGLLSGGSLPIVNVNGDNAEVLDQYVADMQAVDSFTLDLTRNTGVQAWINLYAISQAAERVEGDVDGPALLEALRSGEPLDLPIVGEWDPTATGPLPEAPRISVGTGYLFSYEGGGSWATLDPQDGLDLFELLESGG